MTTLNQYKVVKDRSWQDMARASRFRADYWVTVALLGVLVASGLGAFVYLELEGHWISGMNNQVVWGLPHVVAILLILSASGALNIASMGSVFGQQEYKPWGRFSGLMAVGLLIGGLLILVLDLGRPERLIVAMTHYNFKSIFAWNIILYNGFVAIVIVYLWTMFENRLSHYTKKAGLVAFIWRFVLTTGTGSIFGFLVAREFYDSAMMVPIFIVLSLIMGTALFVLMVNIFSRWSEVGLGQPLLKQLERLMIGLIALELFLIVVFHLTNLYIAEHGDIERFILTDGGGYTWLFWLGQIGIGLVIPLILILGSNQTNRNRQMSVASLLVFLGGISHIYVTIIAGQAFPLGMFPGKEVSSTFFDGVVADYSPSIFELALGMGGLAFACLVVMLVARVLPFFPAMTSSADQDRESPSE